MTTKTRNAVVNSALWAAAGDALGWITELARDGTVQSRTGRRHVREPIPWRRTIGGRFGVRVAMPAGTYSDDTQLRLAVSRAIRGDGAFDAEAFAKIELPIWLSYALGAGNGTKAAASNLSRRGVNWFSNYFGKNGEDYVRAGGNGAAMRVQPHVWVGLSRSADAVLEEVLRDALTTHGHPHGFVGAAFHARMLFEVFRSGSIPSVSVWHDIAQALVDIPTQIMADRQLSAFWVSAWQKSASSTIQEAVDVALDELHSDIEQIRSLVSDGDSRDYLRTLEILGCLSPKYRGSGLKTALAASVLAKIFEGRPAEAMEVSANALDSDTDTIATMTGAMLGAVSPKPPTWPIQDADYVVTEAERLFRISAGETAETFAYPDLLTWIPPSNQSDAVGDYHGNLALLGLGPLVAAGEEYANDDAIWGWYRLPFGQTILVKRRHSIEKKVEETMLPGRPRTISASRELELPLGDAPASLSNVQRSGSQRKVAAIRATTYEGRIDQWTDEVIRSGFDDATFGHLLNLCIDQFGSVEGPIAFVSIVAKAKLSRQRRK